MMDRSGRTAICSIAFIDIVGYSRVPDARQADLKLSFGAAVAEAVKLVAEAERIVIDTGDGAALCFFGDPEDAIFCATAVRDAFCDRDDPRGASLRIGINLGPVRVVEDLNRQQNLIGDGINVAQRVMTFSDPGEILVSRSYYEVVARLNDGNDRLFRYLGIKKDKHIREHQVYAVVVEGGAAALAPEPPVRAVEEDADPSSVVPDELRRLAEQRLAVFLGPLASIMVQRAAKSAESPEAFRDVLAARIRDEGDRAKFHAALADAVADAPRPKGDDAPGPKGDDAPGMPTEARTAGGGPPLSARDLEEVERCLTRHIGPFARVLVRRLGKDAAGRDDLNRCLAAAISDPATRERFLAEVQVRST